MLTVALLSLLRLLEMTGSGIPLKSLLVVRLPMLILEPVLRRLLAWIILILHLSGVQRRVDVLVNDSTLPAIVKSQVGADSDSKHIQSISISTDFSQENILELGRFGPYARYATFPVEVTAEFEVIATSGDLVSVSGNTRNLGDGEPIKILDSAGTVIDLGSNCKLSSVSYSVVTLVVETPRLVIRLIPTTHFLLTVVMLRMLRITLKVLQLLVLRKN